MLKLGKDAGRRVVRYWASFAIGHYFKCEFSHLKRYYRNEHATMCDMCHDAAGKTEWGCSMTQGKQQDTSISYLFWYYYQGYMDWKHFKT